MEKRKLLMDDLLLNESDTDKSIDEIFKYKTSFLKKENIDIIEGTQDSSFEKTNLKALNESSTEIPETQPDIYDCSEDKVDDTQPNAGRQMILRNDSIYDNASNIIIALNDSSTEIPETQPGICDNSDAVVEETKLNSVNQMNESTNDSTNDSMDDDASTGMVCLGETNILTQSQNFLEQIEDAPTQDVTMNTTNDSIYTSFRMSENDCKEKLLFSSTRCSTHLRQDANNMVFDAEEKDDEENDSTDSLVWNMDISNTDNGDVSHLISSKLFLPPVESDSIDCQDDDDEDVDRQTINNTNTFDNSKNIDLSDIIMRENHLDATDKSIYVEAEINHLSENIEIHSGLKSTLLCTRAENTLLLENNIYNASAEQTYNNLNSVNEKHVTKSNDKEVIEMSFEEIYKTNADFDNSCDENKLHEMYSDNFNIEINLIENDTNIDTINAVNAASLSSEYSINDHNNLKTDVNFETISRSFEADDKGLTHKIIDVNLTAISEEANSISTVCFDDNNIETVTDTQTFNDIDHYKSTVETNDNGNNYSFLEKPVSADNATVCLEDNLNIETQVFEDLKSDYKNVEDLTDVEDGLNSIDSSVLSCAATISFVNEENNAENSTVADNSDFNCSINRTEVYDDYEMLNTGKSANISTESNASTASILEETSLLNLHQSINNPNKDSKIGEDVNLNDIVTSNFSSSRSDELNATSILFAGNPTQNITINDLADIETLTTNSELGSESNNLGMNSFINNDIPISHMETPRNETSKNYEDLNISENVNCSKNLSFDQVKKNSPICLDNVISKSSALAVNETCLNKSSCEPSLTLDKNDNELNSSNIDSVSVNNTDISIEQVVEPLKKQSLGCLTSLEKKNSLIEAYVTIVSRKSSLGSEASSLSSVNTASSLTTSEIPASDMLEDSDFNFNMPARKGLKQYQPICKNRVANLSPFRANDARINKSCPMPTKASRRLYNKRSSFELTQAPSQGEVTNKLFTFDKNKVITNLMSAGLSGDAFLFEEPQPQVKVSPILDSPLLSSIAKSERKKAKYLANSKMFRRNVKKIKECEKEGPVIKRASDKFRISQSNMEEIDNSSAAIFKPLKTYERKIKYSLNTPDSIKLLLDKTTSWLEDKSVTELNKTTLNQSISVKYSIVGAINNSLNIQETPKKIHSIIPKGELHDIEKKRKVINSGETSSRYNTRKRSSSTYEDAPLTLAVIKDSLSKPNDILETPKKIDSTMKKSELLDIEKKSKVINSSENSSRYNTRKRSSSTYEEAPSSLTVIKDSLSKPNNIETTLEISMLSPTAAKVSKQKKNIDSLNIYESPKLTKIKDAHKRSLRSKVMINKNILNLKKNKKNVEGLVLVKDLDTASNISSIPEDSVIPKENALVENKIVKMKSLSPKPVTLDAFYRRSKRKFNDNQSNIENKLSEMIVAIKDKSHLKEKLLENNLVNKKMIENKMAENKTVVINADVSPIKKLKESKQSKNILQTKKVNSLAKLNKQSLSIAVSKGKKSKNNQKSSANITTKIINESDANKMSTSDLNSKENIEQEEHETVKIDKKSRSSNSLKSIIDETITSNKSMNKLNLRDRTRTKKQESLKIDDKIVSLNKVKIPKIKSDLSKVKHESVGKNITSIINNSASINPIATSDNDFSIIGNLAQTSSMSKSKRVKRKKNQKINNAKSNLSSNSLNEISNNISIIDTATEISVTNKQSKVRSKKNNEIVSNDSSLNSNLPEKRQIRKTFKQEELDKSKSKEEKNKSENKIVERNTKSKAKIIKKLPDDDSLLNEANKVNDLSTPIKETKSKKKKLNCKILFTGIEESKYIEAIKILGGSIAISAKECTHVVAKTAKRTVKFLCGLGMGVPIVNEEWLKASQKCGNLLDTDEYILCDKILEKKFGFCLRTSLEKARSGPLFAGYRFYLTQNIVPDKESTSDIIQCAGGTVLASLPRKNSGSKKLIVVTCEENVEDLLNELGQLEHLLVSIEFVLSAVIKQHVDLDSYNFTKPKEIVKTRSKKSK